MIYYYNKEMINWIKRTFPTREVKYHDFNFIAIDTGCPWAGVIIKDIEEMSKDDKSKN